MHHPFLHKQTGCECPGSSAPGDLTMNNTAIDIRGRSRSTDREPGTGPGLQVISLIDSSQGHPDLEVMVTPICQMGKLSFGEVQGFAWSQTARTCWSRGSHPGLLASSVHIQRHGLAGAQHSSKQTRPWHSQAVTRFPYIVDRLDPRVFSRRRHKNISGPAQCPPISEPQRVRLPRGDGCSRTGLYRFYP